MPVSLKDLFAATDYPCFAGASRRLPADPWERDKVLPAAELIERLEAEFGPLAPAPDYDPRAPATEFVYAACAR